MGQLSKRDTFSCATFSPFLKCKKSHSATGGWVLHSSTAVMQCHKHVSHMWIEMRCVRERVRLCATDLRRRTWVMMFTTLFHHLSPNNTWNPWNYISLAILCKIFTFSSLVLIFFFPHSSHFHVGCSLPSHESAHVCTRTQSCIHPSPPTPFSHLRCPSFVWAQKGQELRGRREEEEEVCGRMRGHGFKCFHSCLERCM